MQGGEFFDQKKGTTAKSVFSRKTQIRTQAWLLEQNIEAQTCKGPLIFLLFSDWIFFCYFQTEFVFSFW